MSSTFMLIMIALNNVNLQYENLYLNVKFPKSYAFCDENDI